MSDKFDNVIAVNGIKSNVYEKADNNTADFIYRQNKKWENEKCWFFGLLTFALLIVVVVIDIWKKKKKD